MAPIDAELKNAKDWAEERARVWESAGITLRSGRVICAGHKKWAEHLKVFLNYVESLKQERDGIQFSYDSLNRIYVALADELASAEKVVDATDELLSIERGRKSCETIPEWVMQRIESVQAANARHREAHPAEEGEKDGNES